MLRFSSGALWVAVLGACGLFSAPAYGFGHLWHFNEIFSNSSGSVQFIELANHSDFEQFIQGLTVRSTATGKTFTFPTNLPDFNTAHRHLLLATPGFASIPGGVTPDFTIPANFFATGGDTLHFDVYDSFTFPTPQLPTNGLNSLATETRTIVVNSPTNFSQASGSINVVPEPTSAALAVGSVLALALRRRR